MIRKIASRYKLGIEIAFISCLVVILVSASSIVYLLIKNNQYQAAMYPNIVIDNVSVGGLAKEEVFERLDKDYSYLDTVVFEIDYNDQKIATISAQELNIQTDIDKKIESAYEIGRSGEFFVDIRDRLKTLLALQIYSFEVETIYNTKPIYDFLTIAEQTYNIPPTNAKFEFENGKVLAFEIDRPGLRIKREEFIDLISEKLQTLNENSTSFVLTLEDEPVEPDITLSKANDLGIEELIGEGVSDYSGSSADRIYNIKLGTSKFHGALIPPNEEFSFNTIIGDISSNTGYRSSYIIKNGQTVLGDGGGVCQVSTTAFRAALNTGLQIIERHAHAYRVSYYENDSKPGLDATIYTPTVDFRFLNDTPGYILVQTEIDEQNNLLSFRFYGKSDGRRSEVSDIQVWDVVPAPPPKYVDDPNLQPGTVRQIDYAAPGAKSIFNYTVYRNNEVLHEQEFYSDFRPWQAVFLRGV